MAKTPYCLGPAGELEACLQHRWSAGNSITFTCGARNRVNWLILPPARLEPRRERHARLGCAVCTAASIAAVV